MERLAMNLAYNGNSAIPVKFVFQLAAPTYFAPSEWSLLMKVDRLDSEEEFCKMMTGKELEDYDTEIRNISPACIVNEDSVPSLIGYGLIDHCVPLSQKYYLMEAYDRTMSCMTTLNFQSQIMACITTWTSCRSFWTNPLSMQKYILQIDFMISFSIANVLFS